MREFQISGTLGDTYTGILRLKQFGDDPIKVYHYTECKYWQNEIKDIYSLAPNIEVEFIDDENIDIEKFDPLPKAGKMEWFPEFPEIESRFKYNNYILIQANAGKPDKAPLSKRGTKNTKMLSPELIIQLINDNKDKVCILTGTESIYRDITGCVNLVQKITLKEAIKLVQNCTAFVGMEGLLSFVSLSNRKETAIFFTDKHQLAISVRILQTPWQEYCRFFKVEPNKVIEMH